MFGIFQRVWQTPQDWWCYSKVLMQNSHSNKSKLNADFWQRLPSRHSTFTLYRYAHIQWSTSAYFIVAVSSNFLSLQILFISPFNLNYVNRIFASLCFSLLAVVFLFLPSFSYPSHLTALIEFGYLVLTGGTKLQKAGRPDDYCWTTFILTISSLLTIAHLYCLAP
jgi:hypothetical protein